MAMTADAITGDRSLRVKVRDNRYVAAVLVLSMEGQVLSRSPVNQTELGVESVVDLDLSQIYTNHFMVAVCDYASNMAAYEVNFGGSVRVPDANTTLTAALLNDAGLWFVDVDARSPFGYHQTCHGKRGGSAVCSQRRRWDAVCCQ